MKNQKMELQARCDTVILADGAFPQHEIPLNCLRGAKRIISCDGSAKSLVSAGFEPFAIVGDMDSLTGDIAEKYSDRLFRDDDQETNDLTKAVKWCAERGYDELAITGATGKREDHTLGNISLIADYARVVKVTMVTDTGLFLPFNKTAIIPVSPGQQISVFAFDGETGITSEGLLYPLVNRKLSRWWEATLNEATGNSVKLIFSGGPVIVFLKFPEA